MEWSQIFCSLINFTKTNFKFSLYRHITTLTSIQARIVFFKDISCQTVIRVSVDFRFYSREFYQSNSFVETSVRDSSIILDFRETSGWVMWWP